MLDQFNDILNSRLFQESLESCLAHLLWHIKRPVTATSAKRHLSTNVICLNIDSFADTASGRDKQQFTPFCDFGRQARCNACHRRPAHRGDNVLPERKQSLQSIRDYLPHGIDNLSVVIAVAGNNQATRYAKFLAEFFFQLLNS